MQTFKVSPRHSLHTSPDDTRLLSSMVLQLFVMGIENLMEFEFMDTPPVMLLTKALEQLFLLGALDKDKTLTDLGRKMAMLPLEPPYAKLLLSSSNFSCSEEILTTIQIVAVLSVDSIFFNPSGKREEAARARHLISSADGDHITYLKSKKDRDWCTQYFINARNMKKARHEDSLDCVSLTCEKIEDIRNQLEGYCKQVGSVFCLLVGCERRFHPAGEDSSHFLRARVNISSTMFVHRVLQQHCNYRSRRSGMMSLRLPRLMSWAGKSYRMEVTAQEVYLHPSSVLFGRRAKSVVFDELVQHMQGGRG
eukprot:766883-Hanusia_phi.AAC.5